MRMIFLIMVTAFCNLAISQDKPPTAQEAQAEIQQAIRDARQQIVEIKSQIAEAKQNKDDPENIQMMEQQLASLQHMVTMLGKTNITGNKTPKTLPPPKNTEPAEVSPFTPITKQPVKPPTQAQATDRLLWYRGRRIDANTLITPSGLTVRYNRRNNTLTFQPDNRTDTPYYNLVKSVGQMKRWRNEYALRIDGMLNSFFMFDQIEDAYKEYEVFKNRYYNMAKNTIQLSSGPTHAQQLETAIQELADHMRTLPGVKFVSSPKRPHDLCLCDAPLAKEQYNRELVTWLNELFRDEIRIISLFYKIEVIVENNVLAGNRLPARAISVNKDWYEYYIIALERMKVKVDELVLKYEQDDVLIEDGLVYAGMELLRLLMIVDRMEPPQFSVTKKSIEEQFKKIGRLVYSDIFEKYIERMKAQNNFSKVFDYGLYAAHELNKKVLIGKSDVNKELFSIWMEGLRKYNRFKVTIELDFNYQQVDKSQNDKIVMWAKGSLKNEGDLFVSLGRHDCHWDLYLTEQDHRNRNTTGEEFKIPLKVMDGKKDYIDDKKNEFPYTGPGYMRMVFPTFNINTCGGQSTVMMDVLSYTPADLQRHKADKFDNVYTTDMLQYGNKMFLSAKKTQMDVNKLISTGVEMMNVHSTQMSESTGDPAFDRMKFEFKMNKKKYDLQYSLSQTTHTGKTVVDLDRPSALILCRAEVDLADPNDKDREYGIMLTKGMLTLRIWHNPL